MDAHSHATSKQIVTVEAVVFRANGTVEDLGVIARHHPNPLIRLMDRIRGMGRIRRH